MKKMMLMLALLPVLYSCAPEGVSQSFVVTGCTLVDYRNQCKLSTTGNVTELRSVGILDLLFTNKYWVAPVIMNDTNPPTDGSTIGGKGISVLGAHLSYQIGQLGGQYDTKKVIKPYKVFMPASGFIKPGEITTIMLEGIPAEIGALLDRDMAFDERYSGGYIAVTIQLEGVMTDGTSVMSNKFVYPIQLCRGCLLYYPIPLSQCCNGTIGEVYICYPGQDDGIPCDLGCSVMDMYDRYAEKKAMLLGTIDSLADPIPKMHLLEGQSDEFGIIQGQP
jgi:hypothetical protein